MSIVTRNLGKLTQKIGLIILLTIIFLLLSQINSATLSAQGGATTYYISPSGDDNNSGTSEAEPWATFRHALGYWDSNTGSVEGQLHPGDTLIIMDGLYYQSIESRDDGLPGQPITLRAQNDGQVTLDGQNQKTAIQLNNQYFVIEGIIARNGPKDRGQHVIQVSGNHNILRRVSAYDANTDDNNFVISVSGAYNLLEDCVAAGSGRKMIVIFKGQYNTIRRCLADWRTWDGRDAPQAWPWGDGIELYQGDYNIIENSIAYGHAAEYGISLLANGSIAQGSTCIGNKVLGSMAINTGRNHDRSFVYWGPDPNNPPLTQIQPTIRPQPSAHRPDQVRRFDNPHLRSGISLFGGSGLVEDNFLQDILVWGSAGHGLSVFDTYTNNTPNVRNNVINRGTFINNGLDVGQNFHVDDPAQVTVTNSFVAGDFPVKGEGARLEHRYVNGELMDGTNGQPAQPLWPWPMDDRIQAELGYSVEARIRPLVENSAIGFVAEVAPSTQRIKPGDTATTTLSLRPTNGFTEPVTVEVGNAYPNLNINLPKSTIYTLPQTLTLTLTDTHDPAFSEMLWYTIPLTATGGDISQTAAVNLLLNGPQIFLPVIIIE